MCYLTITQAKRVTDGCRCVERSQLMLEKTLIFPPNSYGCLRNLSSLVEDISQLHSHIIFFSYFQLNSGEWSVQSNTCRTKHSLFNDSCQLNCFSQVTRSRKLSNVELFQKKIMKSIFKIMKRLARYGSLLLRTDAKLFNSSD